MQGVWDEKNPLERAQELVSTAVKAHAVIKKEELDRSRQKIIEENNISESLAPD